jgi:hypothetical protein
MVSDGFRANVSWGDDVPPALSLPQFPIVVPADRPAGAVVTYTVTASDTDEPNPTVSVDLATVLIERANRIRGVLACS